MIWQIFGMLLFIGMIGLIGHYFGFWVAFIVFCVLSLIIPKVN